MTTQPSAGPVGKRKKGKRGFASMSPERVKEIASRGGKSIPAEKRPFARSRDLAVAAGRKGGSSVKARAAIAKVRGSENA